MNSIISAQCGVINILFVCRVPLYDSIPKRQDSEAWKKKFYGRQINHRLLIDHDRKFQRKKISSKSERRESEQLDIWAKNDRDPTILVL